MSDNKKHATIDIDAHVLREFALLFKGSDTHFGVTELGEETEIGKKREAKSHTEKGEPTSVDYSDHLNGRRGLGIAPLTNREYVNFAVIDIDVYAEKMQQLVAHAVADSNLPLFPILSKSGGLHLYVFFKEQEKAADVRAVLFEIAAIFALDHYGKQFNSNFDKTEIFPKQNIETANNGSNWINLPYFDYKSTTRYLLDHEAKPVTDIMDAMARMEEGRTTLKDLKSLMLQIPGSDGPPCLQHMRLFKNLGKNEGRNNYFFSLGRYLKLSESDDIENVLTSANNDLAEPLPDSEWRATLQSALTTDASYLCQKEPLCSLCSRKLCSTRQFGVGNVAVSNMSFGQMTVIMADPPTYIWEIDGQRFEFYDEAELIDQHTFQRMAMRKLGVVPRLLKQDVWLGILNRALANKIVEVPEAGMGNSAGELLMAQVTNFLMYRGATLEKGLVAHGSVFHDKTRNRVLFRMDALHRYLTRNEIKFMTITQLQHKLSNEFNAVPTRITTPNGQSRCWELDPSLLAPWMKPDAEDVDMDALAAQSIEKSEM